MVTLFPGADVLEVVDSLAVRVALGRWITLEEAAITRSA